MNNLEIYNAVKDVPEEAKKPIIGGRLKGFTDINPMWRIKKMTEVFGPVGYGWWSTIDKMWTENGTNGEVIALVQVSVYVMKDGKVSTPIPGVGASLLITKESSGLRTDDEAFKKAYTDALSVAFKAFGVGASVYFEKDRDSKYPTGGEDDPKQEEPQRGTIKRAVNNAPSQSQTTIVRTEVKTLQEQAKDLIKTKSEELKVGWSFFLNILTNEYKVDHPDKLTDEKAEIFIKQIKEMTNNE